MLKLIDMPPGRFEAGEILWRGRDLIPLAAAEMDTHPRHAKSRMVFQEPMTSLNPVYTVGEQIGEALRAHERLSRKAAIDARGRDAAAGADSQPANAACTTIRTSSPAACASA